jgi:hypothetical protein
VIGSKTICRLLVAGCLVFLQVTQANAIMSVPEPLDTPVPEKWRAPLARFLSDLDVTDAASTVEASKATPYQDPGGGPERMIFRVLHKRLCSPDQDECLRIIAHTEKDELVSDAMFYAGGKINHGDVILQTMGMRSVPTFFHSRHQVVGVIVTVKGLLVSSSPVEESK